MTSIELLAERDKLLKETLLAVEANLRVTADVLENYELSPEQLASWQRRHDECVAKRSELRQKLGKEQPS